MPLRGAPTDEIVRAGEDDFAVSAAELGLGTVEQHPAALDPVRQEGGVLVLRVLDHAVALGGTEVLRRGEKHSRPGRAVGRAGDQPAPELLDPDDPSILEPPLLARNPVGGGEQRLGFDCPSVDAVRRASHGEV
jgi:hypothetical protein